MIPRRFSVSSKRTLDWVFLCLLLILAVVFLWRLVLGNLVMAGLDVFTYFYPYKAYAAEEIRSGSLPLWNPYLFMGVPFLANIQAAVLYPLNLPFYWLSAPDMVKWSILLHLFLAGAFAYGFARQALGLAPGGAMVAATTLAFGGFLGAQAEHINQLSVLVWLPLLLWLFYLAYARRSLVYVLMTAIVTGVQFLGGHTQSSYINLACLGCYSLYLPFAGAAVGSAAGQRASSRLHKLGLSLGIFAVAVLLGAALAGAQLVPTLELSRLSIRSTGLPYRQAVSFSLYPGSLLRSLLPSFADSPFSEYVAYVGILPLLLAVVAVWRRRRSPQALFLIFLASLGLFLALGIYNPVYYMLYRLVPGFGLFRVPARWLYMYVVGVALLAGLGMEELRSLSCTVTRPRKRWILVASGLAVITVMLVVFDPPSPLVIAYWALWTCLSALVIWIGINRQRRAAYLAAVISLVVGELFLASRHQAFNSLTAPEAFSSLRSSVAYLLTDTSVYRVFSFSDGAFDPGDIKEIQENLSSQLPEECVYDYLVATKQKEVLTPNLPLLYRVQSVDGYDGGILPLARYVYLERLLLPEEQVSIDGRLQGRVVEMPSSRVLNLSNVKYVMTDKTYDLWVDGAYYDLGQQAVLGGTGPRELVLHDLPSFQATALGVVSYLVEAEDVAQGSVVAEITVEDDAGHGQSFELRAGEDTAQGEYSTAPTLHQTARVVGHWRDNPAGNDYYTLLQWGQAIYPSRISVKVVTEQAGVRLRGMTLLDQRTGTHRALVVSTEGNYRLVHSGDVKIYENLDVLPRAFAVHEARFLETDAEVLVALRDEAFDPAREVLLSGQQGLSQPSGDGCEDEARLASYAAERVGIEVEMDCPGYLVLTDAYYPGWVALVDGQPQQILRADLYFRAVALSEGHHLVEFRYEPASLKLGLALSLVAALSVAGGVVWRVLGR
jgi:hypothetical protein